MLNRNFIYTENPLEEQWRILSQFTYEKNIKKYCENKDHFPNDDFINAVSGSILQAQEFFAASNTSSLQISPVLVYYGAINLLYGISCLIKNELIDISNHGMKWQKEVGLKSLSEHKLKVTSMTDGGLSTFLNVFGFSEQQYQLLSGQEFSLSHLLSTIPDLYIEFINQFGFQNTRLIPVETIHTDKLTYERVLVNDPEHINYIIKLLANSKNIQQNYLKPAYSGGELFLNRNLKFKENFEYSISNSKFLLDDLMLGKKTIKIPTLISCLMSLFILCSVSRYHPSEWNPFASRDSTGERYIIEKFLALAKRILPNLALNNLLGKRIIFTNIAVNDTNHLKYITENRTKEIIRNELLKFEERQRKG